MTALPDIIDKLRILRMLMRATFEQWQTEIWPHDLDTRYCCDGRECGCGGSTFREIYMWEVES